MEATLRRLGDGPARLLVTPELEEAVRGAGLLAPDALERAFGGPAAGRGRGPTALLELGAGRRVLLRRLRHGGLLGPLLGDIFWGTTRCEAELRVTAALRAAGAPVPRPALVLTRRRLGPLHVGALGTLFEEGSLDGLAFLESGPDARALQRAAFAAGCAVRRFHDAGGSHADLQVKNLLFREEADRTECLVIDLDRAERRDEIGPEERMAQLMRLYRSLRKRGMLARVGARGLARFFAGYCGDDRKLRRALRAQLPRELRRIALHSLHY